MADTPKFRKHIAHETHALHCGCEDGPAQRDWAVARMVEDAMLEAVAKAREAVLVEVKAILDSNPEYMSKEALVEDLEALVNA